MELDVEKAKAEAAEGIRELVAKVGSQMGAAQLLRLSQPFVSMVCSGNARLSLEVAVRILPVLEQHGCLPARTSAPGDGSAGDSAAAPSTSGGVCGGGAPAPSPAESPGVPACSGTEAAGRNEHGGPAAAFGGRASPPGGGWGRQRDEGRRQKAGVTMLTEMTASGAAMTTTGRVVFARGLSLQQRVVLLGLMERGMEAGPDAFRVPMMHGEDPSMLADEMGIRESVFRAVMDELEAACVVVWDTRCLYVDLANLPKG